MKPIYLILILIILGIPALLFGQSGDQPSTRQMNLINWMEFQKVVPSKIETVLLPTGTIEPHGVIPNGADNIAPEAMAGKLAERVNAMVAPTLNYGVTGSMSAFAGAFQISEEAYGPFVKDILRGLAKNQFKNIIILNGHGGPQSAILHKIASEVSQEKEVRILVINWWSLASDDTFAVFDENGGHAGNNETAYVQAVVPEYVHPDWYKKDMTTAYPAGSSWAAYPFPSSIGLYEKGQGYPTFDEGQAQEYFEAVNKRVGDFIQEIIKKWDMAKLYKN